MLGTIPIAQIRGEIPAAAVGFMLLGLGLAAGAVCLIRRRRSDLALLYFSALCTLYSVRLLCDLDAVETLYSLPEAGWQRFLNVLTYLVPVPALLFFEQVMGRGRWSLLRRLWQANTLLAAVAIPLELVSRHPGLMMGPYRFLVIVTLSVSVADLFLFSRQRTQDLLLLRASISILAAFALYENLRGFGLLPGPPNLEPVGFLIFVAGLGIIAARRVSQSQERLAAIHQELETARRIQESTLPGEPPRLPGLDLAARYVPASEVAGDFYDFLPTEDGGLSVIVADVSGHGVPAALVAAMLKVAVAAQSAHAASPARLLTELNQIFHGRLRQQFITALCVHLRHDRLLWASAGHPPPLLWKAREGRVEELMQPGMVLGRLRRASYTEATTSLEPGDRLLLFTDGIPEALNPAGEPWGDDRLRALLAEHAREPASALADAVLSAVAAWTRRKDGLDDDLTLVAVGIDSP